jgi:HEAT repeat protein
MVKHIGRIGPAAAAAVPALQRLLRSEGEAYHLVNVIRALGAIGPPAGDAASDLCDFLGDERFEAEVIGALQRMGPAAREAVPELIDALRVSRRPGARVGDWTWRKLLAQRWSPHTAKILRALAAIEPEPKVLRDIRPLLDDPETLVRIAAAEVVLKIAPESEDAKTVLLDALKSSGSRERRAAARALRDLAPRVEVAIPALIAELKDPTEDASPGPSEPLPPIPDFFGLHEYLTRGMAAEALGAYGPLARGAVPGLVTALGDGQPRVRCAAAVALGRIGVATPAGVEALARLSEVPTGYVPAPALPRDEYGEFFVDEDKEAAILRQRIAAIEALKRLGAGAEAAGPTLRNQLTDAEWTIRRVACDALGAIDASADSLEALGRCLRDDFKDVREAAQAALILQGKKAEPVLRRLLDDHDEVVRELAGEALDRIRRG